jgi:hypothetical protein
VAPAPVSLVGADAASGARDPGRQAQAISDIVASSSHLGSLLG